jgi:hypothetical protein
MPRIPVFCNTQIHSRSPNCKVAMSGVILNRTVRLLVNAGAAKPGPAIGQALGPLGLNMADFCKQFNERTKTYEKDITLPVKLSGNKTCFYYWLNIYDMFLFKRKKIILLSRPLHSN